MPEHKKDCRWELIKSDECSYRDTHHYCPHQEHACNCDLREVKEEDNQLIPSLSDL